MLKIEYRPIIPGILMLILGIFLLSLILFIKSSHIIGFFILFLYSIFFIIEGLYHFKKRIFFVNSEYILSDGQFSPFKDVVYWNDIKRFSFSIGHLTIIGKNKKIKIYLPNYYINKSNMMKIINEMLKNAKKRKFKIDDSNFNFITCEQNV